MESALRLQVALESARLNSLTRALSELAGKMAYQIKPPYTEVVHLRAREELRRFAIQFSAKLHLHYSSLRTHDEGLVFTVGFSGEAYADSPNPPIDELFAAGLVDSFIVYGYGKRWSGRTIPTPDQFAKNLEVTSRTLNQISTSDFLARIEAEV
jgi:hypothetical protein